MMKTMTTAAGLLVAVTACVVFGVLFRTQSTLAFAELIKPILTAKTARFNMVVETKQTVPQTIRMFVLEPNRCRQEMPSGQISIGNAGTYMVLMPAQKTAIVVQMTDIPAQQKTADYFYFLRTNLRATDDDASSKREPLGRKKIAGREAIGFRVKRPNADMTIWGDPETGLPIVVEMTSDMMPDGKVTMSDFEFDVELDEELFKTEPPEGYTVQQRSMTMPAEKDLIQALKMLSDDNGGLFPATFGHTAISAFIANWVQKHHKGAPNATLTKEVTDLTFPLTQGLMFAAMLPAESNARYAGKGIKSNDATQAVFWYLPKGATSYRVIYGDLSVKEQNAVPESPNAARVTLAVNVDDTMRELKQRMPALPAVPGPQPPRKPTLAAPPAAPEAESKPDDPAARQIITQTINAYAECKTYRDSGTVTSLFVMDNGKNNTTERPFKTAFVRPGRFRFEFTNGQGDPQRRYIIWSQGMDVRTWWDVKPGIEKPESLAMAISGANGVSGGSALTIPGLLMPNEVSSGIFAYIKIFRGLTLADEATLGTVECFRIEAMYGQRPTTVWIDKKTYLVRRIDDQVQIPNGRVETTTTYDPAFDEAIADNLLEFDPPDGD